jgi:hypothetical protein
MDTNSNSVQVKYPSSEQEENELLLSATLQLVTIAWTKLTRRLLKKKGNQ